ncbi:excisionase [Tardiphaga alba]|uniref:excisionase n=1 Tax=Tardiphaga alba TaxID=340268 RepID=UPI001BA87B12|nr:excisionase [Tardiphaga alba]
MDEEHSKFTPNAPLRLEVAVKAAFPAGGLTVAGLRKEIARGRLEVELIAGKHFTTLAAIERMRERCRSNPMDTAASETLTQRDVASIAAKETHAASSALLRLVKADLERSRAKRQQARMAKGKKKSIRDG